MGGAKRERLQALEPITAETRVAVGERSVERIRTLWLQHLGAQVAAQAAINATMALRTDCDQAMADLVAALGLPPDVDGVAWQLDFASGELHLPESAAASQPPADEAPTD